MWPALLAMLAATPPWAPEHWRPVAVRAIGVTECGEAIRLDIELDAPNRVHAELWHDDADLVLTLRRAALAISDDPQSAGTLAAIEVGVRPGDIVDLRARGARDLAHALEPTETGFHLWLARDARALPAPRVPPRGRRTPPPPDVSARVLARAEDALHRGAAAAGRGEHAAAIAVLAPVVDGDAPPALREAASRSIAESLEAAGLPLLAVPWRAAGLRHATHADDQRIHQRVLQRVWAQHPGALELVVDDLGAAVGRAPDLAAWLTVTTARLSLRRGDHEGAARRLAGPDRGDEARARYITTVIAAAAGDDEAARVHAEALATDVYASAEVRAQAAVTLARLAYQAGHYDEALRRFRRVDPHTPAATDAAYEAIWAELKLGVRPRLEPLVPLRIEGHQLERAVLLGVAYAESCYPRRAAELATAVLDLLPSAPDAVEAIRAELARLASPDWLLAAQPVRARIEPHLEAISRIGSARIRRTRIEALRLRYAADTLIDLEHAPDIEHAPAIPEPEGYRLEGGEWVDPAVVIGALTDRCPDANSIARQRTHK